METGEAFKGACWCEGPQLTAAAAARLQDTVPENRCLCRACLEALALDPEISWSELASRAAIAPGEGDYYMENGCMVFTAQYHTRRGYCCGSGCRHCPY
jgi:hypothetical protein